MARLQPSLLLSTACCIVLMHTSAGEVRAHGSDELVSGLPVLRATGPGAESANAARLSFPLSQPVSISGGYEVTGDNHAPVLSADSHVVVFESDSVDLAGGNPNGVVNLLIFDTFDHQITRIAPEGVFPDGNSESASVSANGDLIAFESTAGNLVDGDTNGTRDVFVYDRRNASITLVSTGFVGQPADGQSFSPQISADGNYVAFTSAAGNLVPGDNNGSQDVFVHSLQSGLTERLEVTGAVAPAAGRQIFNDEPDISGDGRFVVFSSYAQLPDGETRSGTANIFVFDRQSGSSTLVSTGLDDEPANRSSDSPTISDDGRWISFASGANNLVKGDSNQRKDVFLYDREQDRLRLISQSLDGAGASDGDSINPRTSADGKHVVFQSNMPEVPATEQPAAFDIFIFDTGSGDLRRALNTLSAADRNSPGISENGDYLAYAGVAAGNEADGSRQYSSVYLVKLRD